MNIAFCGENTFLIVQRSAEIAQENGRELGHRAFILHRHHAPGEGHGHKVLHGSHAVEARDIRPRVEGVQRGQEVVHGEEASEERGVQKTHRIT